MKHIFLEVTRVRRREGIRVGRLSSVCLKSVPRRACASAIRARACVWCNAVPGALGGDGEGEEVEEEGRESERGEEERALTAGPGAAFAWDLSLSTYLYLYLPFTSRSLKRGARTHVAAARPRSFFVVLVDRRVRREEGETYYGEKERSREGPRRYTPRRITGPRCRDERVRQYRTAIGRDAFVFR